MSRARVVAATAWTVSILAVVAGLLLPRDRLRTSLALFAFAVALALLVAVGLVADGLRARRRRRRALAAAARSALGRLEYIPTVTTPTRRIRWRGSTSRVLRERPAIADMVTTGPDGELVGSVVRAPRT